MAVAVFMVAGFVLGNDPNPWRCGVLVVVDVAAGLLNVGAFMFPGKVPSTSTMRAFLERTEAPAIPLDGEYERMRRKA